MNSISANDLKTKGVSAIERALADQPEVSLTVRGQAKYVVMSREQYAHLRECELEAALAESKADLDAGRFVKAVETSPQKASHSLLLPRPPQFPQLRVRGRTRHGRQRHQEPGKGALEAASEDHRGLITNH